MTCNHCQKVKVIKQIIKANFKFIGRQEALLPFLQPPSCRWFAIAFKRHGCFNCNFSVLHHPNFVGKICIMAYMVVTNILDNLSVLVL